MKLKKQNVEITVVFSTFHFGARYHSLFQVNGNPILGLDIDAKPKIVKSPFQEPIAISTIKVDIYLAGEFIVSGQCHCDVCIKQSLCKAFLLN